MHLEVDKLPLSYGEPNIPIQPIVSVCVATYNHARYLDDCLNSILEQQCSFDIEILIGEDDSTDGTRALCQRFAQEHPNRIKLFLHHRDNVININGRSTGRFNFLWNLSQAKGTYIALCEGDDYWTDPYKLQKQVDVLEQQKNCALVFSNGRVEYGESGLSSHPVYRRNVSNPNEYQAFPIPPEFTTLTDLAHGNFIHTPGVLFRNWIKDEGLPSYLTRTSIGDWPLHLYTATKGDIAYIDEEMFVYRVHGGGVYSKKSAADKQEMTLGQFEPMIGEIQLEGEALTAFLTYVRKQVLNYLYHKDEEVAFQYLAPLFQKLETYHPDTLAEIRQLHEEQKAKQDRAKPSVPPLYKRAIRKILGKLKP